MSSEVLRLEAPLGARHAGRAEAGERMPISGISKEDTRQQDSELIRAAQRGNRQAFDALVRQYDQQVLRLALHLTGNAGEAQDIYQEAFLKAYRYLPNFRFECSFYTWMYRIVTNICLDQMRRRKVRKEESAIRMDTDGGEIDLLAQVSDERSMADPHRELERQQMGAHIAQRAHGFRVEALRRAASADDWRNVEHHGRDGQEHALPGDEEAAEQSGSGALAVESMRAHHKGAERRRRWARRAKNAKQCRSR